MVAWLLYSFISSTFWILTSSQTYPCSYNEPYIYWNNTDYPSFSGFYVQDSSIFYDNSPPYDGTAPQYVTCGVPNFIENGGVFNGTYMYILEGSQPNPKYLFQISIANKNRLVISSRICVLSSDGFSSDPDATTAILDGTNCDWTSINSANGVPWEDITGTAISGSVNLCDRSNGCFTENPTASPTMAPHPTTAMPTSEPTTSEPTQTPTESTSNPTGTPSKTPTIRPTKLPTAQSENYLEPPCPAMIVHNLDQAFSSNQVSSSSEKFNEVKNYTFNQRRIWTNGHIEIFFSDRFGEGRWSISNQSYHLMNDEQNIVDGGMNQSFPGNADGGYGIYDHFPNDNPLAIPDKTFTLQFECMSLTRFPSKSPTHSPSQAPTLTPSLAPTLTPSASPIASCNTLSVKYEGNSSCDSVPIELNIQYTFLLQPQEYNNHSFWIRNVNQQELRWPIYYSQKLQAWIIVWHEDENNANFNADQAFVNREAAGMETPPIQSVWQWHDNVNLFEPTCDISLTIRCQVTMRPSERLVTADPTPAPSSSPSQPPTSAPSDFPSPSPSAAPTQPPTESPTSAPTLLCGGLMVRIESNVNDANYANYFEGTYRRQSEFDLRDDHYWWQSREEEGSQIYFSSFLFHNSWIIQSQNVNSYWIFREYDANIYNLQPPLFDSWQYYEQDSIFPMDFANISLNCSYDLYPTNYPTMTPSSSPSAPPTNAPTLAPSKTPSSAPSNVPSAAPTFMPTTASPTSAPSQPPTMTPTAAPTREDCQFMQVYADSANISFVNGLYELMNVPKNGFSAWQFDKYIIQKTANGQYWTIDDQTDGGVGDELSADDLVSSDNILNWRPPEYAYWQFWTTRPNPTKAPTDSPSENPSAQTLHPTMNPSENPTKFPSIEPTIQPTEIPTLPSVAPSKNPTDEPTFEPTMYPTEEPTIEPTSLPTVDPTQEPTVALTKDPTTEPTFEPTMEPTVEPLDNNGRRLLQNPPQGTQVYGDAFKILMDCVNTDSPTLSPTTFEPTMAPTSTCLSLSISTNDDVQFEFSGEYILQNNYLINDYVWFLSVDGRSSLEYNGGHWSVVRRDLDDGNDEDIIAIYRDETMPSSLKWLLLSPQNATWYLLYDEADIVININCVDSIPPTPDPSMNPTSAPITAEESKPVWTECKENWFAFVSASDYATKSYGVYWKEPIAQGENNGIVSVSRIGTNANISLGEALDFGFYDLIYRVSDVLNGSLFRDCNVSLFVIGNAQFSTLSYCLDSNFVINANFNETYFEKYGFDKFEAAQSISIDGYSTHPDLLQFDQNCYVFGQQMVNFSQIELNENEAATFLGIKADKMVWDILIVIAVCCLLSLCLFKMMECCLDYRRRKKEKNEEIEQRLLSENEAANVDDDDIILDDIKHQTATSDTANSVSPLLMGSSTMNDGYEPGSGSNAKVMQTSSNPNLAAVQAKNNAAINMLIGSDNEEKDGIEGGGGTVEMQQMPPIPPMVGVSVPLDVEENVELEMAASKQALPPEPAYSEKQIVADNDPLDVVAELPPEPAFAQQPNEKSPSLPPMNKVESDEEDDDDEFDSDSEFEFQV